MKGFFSYARGEAQKLAINGCACVEDKAVFGWAVHFFEEDEIKEPKTIPESLQPSAPKKVIETNSKPKKAQAETPKKEKVADKPGKKAKAKVKDESQMSIFNMRGFKRFGV